MMCFITWAIKETKQEQFRWEKEEWVRLEIKKIILFN